MTQNYTLNNKYNLTFGLSATGTKVLVAAYDNDNNTPVILWQDTELIDSATEIYKPGSGTRIHIKSGEYVDLAWVVGDFNIKAGRIEDGAYWYDDAYVSYFASDPDSLHVGPGDDYLVLVSAGDKLYESYFANSPSAYWLEINESLPFSVYNFHRLDWDLYQIQISNNYFYQSEVLNASFSGGDEFFDITGVIGYPVTSMIYG